MVVESNGSQNRPSKPRSKKTGPRAQQAAARPQAAARVAPQQYEKPTASAPVAKHRAGDPSPVDLFVVDGQVVEAIPPGKTGTRLARPGVALTHVGAEYLAGKR